MVGSGPLNSENVAGLLAELERELHRAGGLAELYLAGGADALGMANRLTHRPQAKVVGIRHPSGYRYRTSPRLYPPQVLAYQPDEPGTSLTYSLSLGVSPSQLDGTVPRVRQGSCPAPHRLRLAAPPQGSGGAPIRATRLKAERDTVCPRCGYGPKRKRVQHL